MMRRGNERGAITTSVTVAVTMTLLFIGTLIFAVVAYMGQQDYKNNTQEKIDAAVEVAKKQAETAKDNEFAEASKSPVKTYQGSSTFGNVSFEYPKTYSAYVIDKGAGGSTVEGYFHPNVVPYINDESVSFGLRFKVVNDSYASVLKTFDAGIKNGKTKVTAFRAAKVQQTLGTRVDGQLTTRKQGSMIVLPLRDKTIEIWTESNEYFADFNKYVVPSISFVP